MMRTFAAIALAGLCAAGHPPGMGAVQRADTRVVTSLSTYAAIAREIVGERGTVVSIGRGDENPHYVQPRPSFARTLQQADMFVATGLDLELWVPALLDRANNSKVREGSAGYVTAYTGIDLFGVPASVSRAQGDIHAFGNPHIWADPVNGIIIGRNILTGLTRVAPQDAEYFRERYAAWRDRVLRALVGDTLIELLGAETVFDLAVQHKLWGFLGSQSYQGRPLRDRIGGWLREGLVLRGREMVCYHKEWDYFTRRFGIQCVAFVEPKPGIPPTPRHVAALIRQIRAEGLSVILTSNFYNQNQVRTIAARTGGRAVIVPANAGGAPGTESYIDLVSHWVRELANAFGYASEHR
ncbi:MAG: zinc ABC transporter substrate-binding protein [Gemmatimonadetes bacterium]|nr:zinc ABC transporter substrate-binding protein [Gemmatimonadota bacterium]